MTEAIAVAEIGLRITEAAWRGNGSQRPCFVAHAREPLRGEARLPGSTAGEPAPREAHRLALEYLSRFWAADRSCTAVVTNISMSETGQKLFLVRPAMEGAMTAGYGSEAGIPAFRCVLKDGYFLAIGFESGRFPNEAGADELVLNGPVYVQAPPNVGEVLVPTRPPASLPAEALAAITKLPFRRLLAAQKVDAWAAFLKWQVDLVHRRQIGLRYEFLGSDEPSRMLRFRVRSTVGTWQQLRRLRGFHAIAMPVSGSLDPQQWTARENARGTLVGEVLPDGLQPDLKLEDAEKLEDSELLWGVVETCPHEGFWDDSPYVPPEGFLVNAIHMELVPLQRQQRALAKLVRGEHVNPRLSDFLFQAEQARVPDAPIMVEDSAAASCDAPGLNSLQKQAVAKALAAPDMFLLQGPPGTGKTVVLAGICWQAVLLGQRVLVASQANLAVDNVLARLAADPRLRPLRVRGGRERGRTDSPSSEELAVGDWLGRVRDACAATFREGEDLAAAHEVLERLWPRLEDALAEWGRLRADQARLKQPTEETAREASERLERLGRLEREGSVLALAVRRLEGVQDDLRAGASCTDEGEWIHLMDRRTRQDLFADLGTWRHARSLPRWLAQLLPVAQVFSERHGASAAGGSRLGRLWARVRSWLSRRRADEPVQGPPPEAGWAAAWTQAVALLNHARVLGTKLPQLASACQDSQQVCIASSMAPVADLDWASASGRLHEALVCLPDESVAALGIARIAESLRPRKQFIGQLGHARDLVESGMSALLAVTEDLEAALTAVAASAKAHLADRLRCVQERVEGARTTLREATARQQDVANELEAVKAEIAIAESRWNEAIAALPAALRSRLGMERVPIGSESLSALQIARTAYLADTRDRVAHHRLWGPIQAEWVRLLREPTDADRRRIEPMYMRRCNVVGVTCSCCGNYRDFLAREEFHRFDICLVEEVSKATPPELLLAALPASKLILAGDFKQLPPTFKEGPFTERPFDEMAEVDEEFEQVLRYKDLVTSSLFKKLFSEAPDILKEYLLDQYRMHPQVMEVINQFYDGQLRCGMTAPDEQCDHGLAIQTDSGTFLSPANHVLWVDTSYNLAGRPVRERQVGTSKANDLEAQAVARMVKLLNDACRRAGRPPRSQDVAIITLYGSQAAVIRRFLDRLKHSDKETLNIRLDTVDNFQGAECPIVIVSLVRSKPGRIGRFAKTFERINVAMSRAQKLLIVLGAVKTFARVEVPLPAADGTTVRRRCYGHILDVVKRHGGFRSIRDLWAGNDGSDS